MMKINRRDYLKKLGAAGVFAGAVGLEGFAHEYGNPQTSCPVECPPPGAPLVWEPRWCEDFPRREHVKLIFEGLMGIAPRRQANGKFVCDIGFHSRGDSPIHHHLSISAYSNVVDANNCPDASYKTPAQAKIKKIALDVLHPDIVDQTVFYQRGRADTRQALTCYEDFRWIVDFESGYLYQRHLPAGSYLQKNKNVYRPILTVPYGIFYTLRKTASTFRAQTDDGLHVSHLGNVADLIAANIYVASGSSVKLTVDSASYTIRAPGEIYFKNHCMSDDTDGECQFQPYNLKDKKKRSDFFLNYKAFERNGAPEYQLYLLDSHVQTKMPDLICERERFGKKLTDESPCSAAGYGGEGKGFPPSS